MTIQILFPRIFFKTGEFILLSIITIMVAPLIILVWLLDVVEKLKHRKRHKRWPQKIGKEFYRNRNNPVIQG